jgi:hypothetical protein
MKHDHNGEFAQLSAHSDVQVHADGVALRFRRSSARGWPMGESHRRAAASDAVVQRARELRAGGMSHRRIGAELGIAWQTCEAWTSNRRRRPHARIVVTRSSVPTREPSSHSLIGKTLG